MCADDRYRETNRILEAALDREPEDRAHFIAAECRSDRSLENSVLRLLALSEKVDEFMDLPPVAAAEIRPGDCLLGRFQIVRALGEGGMGSVFLAADRELGEVAIKTVRLDLRNNPEALERFRAEIRVARRVSHPNVCPIFELFPGDTPAAPLFFTMRYFPGETLAQRLNRGRLAPAEALTIARGIAAGLDALHAEDVIHRDLKPANVILHQLPDGSVRPVIADFGLATAQWAPAPRDSATATCAYTREGNPEPGAPQALGSPDYMAPEQFRGTVTRAADLFAFGVLLFEMVAGSRPFPKEDILQAALRRVCDDAPRLRSADPNLPEAWERVLAKALARDPGARFTSASALIAALESFVTAPPVPWEECNVSRSGITHVLRASSLVPSGSLSNSTEKPSRTPRARIACSKPVTRPPITSLRPI